MSIFEYNEEEVMQYLREEAIELGLAEGENRVNRLIQCLAEAGRTEDIVKAASDKEYQKKLFEEFHL